MTELFMYAGLQMMGLVEKYYPVSSCRLPPHLSIKVTLLQLGPTDRSHSCSWMNYGSFAEGRLFRSDQASVCLCHRSGLIKHL